MKHNLAGVISLAMAVLFSGQQVPTPHPVAPPLSLIDFHGNNFSLSQYKGKVLVLNFWNTKCLLCIKESTTLVSLQNKYRDQSVAVVGVAYDDDAANISEVAEQLNITYPVVLGKATEIQTLYGIHEPPALVMIGRDGRIYSQHREYLSEASLELEAGQLLAAKNDGEVIGFQAAPQSSATEVTPARKSDEDPAKAEIAALSPATRKTLEDHLQAAKCTCGCQNTFLGCLRSGMKCQLRTAAIQKELGKVNRN